MYRKVHFAAVRCRNLAWTLAFFLLGCGSSSRTDLFGRSSSAACGSGSAQCSSDRGSGASASSGDGTGTGGSPGFTGSGGDTSTTAAGGFLGEGGAVTAGSGGATKPVSTERPDGATDPVDAGSPDTGPVPECPLRAFSGTISGSGYKSEIGSVSVTAAVMFTVTANGAIAGTYTAKTPTTETATLSGQMDCGTNAVTITVQDGSYNGLLPFTPGGTFTGTMTGSYAPTATSFSGTWKITENNPSYGGEGAWTAN
jgi:hypothetical protein